MIYPKHLRENVIRPVLEHLDPLIPYSRTAENLLMGTCAQESRGGEFLVQLNDGPARGIYQMEPATERDININFLDFRSKLLNKINHLQLSVSSIAVQGSPEMVGNIYYATAMARVHYYRVLKALPDDTPEALAKYWKKYYNTIKGKGTVEQFIENYEIYTMYL